MIGDSKALCFAIHRGEHGRLWQRPVCDLVLSHMMPSFKRRVFTLIAISLGGSVASPPHQSRKR